MLGFRPRKKKQRTTLGLVRYSPDVWWGRSPTLRDVEALCDAGVRSLLNLNTEGEPGQLLSPNVEASWAHAFALQHERVSIRPRAWRSEWVDAFLETLQGIVKPTYVHSLEGRRAAVLFAIQIGLETGVSAQDALAEVRALGIDCGPDVSQRFVVSELAERGARRSTEITGRAS